MRLRLASGSRSVPAKADGHRAMSAANGRREPLSSTRAVSGSTPRAACSCCQRLPISRTLARSAGPSGDAPGSGRDLPQASHLGRFDRQRQRLELGADRLARRDPLRPCDVVAAGIAREEPIAGAAEALPDRLGPALLDRADRLPLGLQAPELRRRVVPVRRLGQRFGLRAQRFLLRQVLGPRRLARGEILVAPVKKRSQAVRKRSQIAFSRPRETGPMVFHSACSCLHRLGGLNPARGVGERLGLLAERDLLRQVRVASLGLGGKVRFAPAHTSSCAALKRRHSASACARGTSAA